MTKAMFRTNSVWHQFETWIGRALHTISRLSIYYYPGLLLGIIECQWTWNKDITCGVCTPFTGDTCPIGLHLIPFHSWYMLETFRNIVILFSFTGHPHFFNQLSCGLDLVSMAGEWLTATANTNMFTYEIAPVFILMETVVMTHMREIIGKDWTNGDSIFAPGKFFSTSGAIQMFTL